MKLVSFLRDENEQLGVIINDQLVDIEDLHPDLPVTMNMFLYYWDDAYAAAQAGVLLMEEGGRNLTPIQTDEPLLSPLPFPASYRRFESGFNRFHFSNHQSIRGGGTVSIDAGKYRQLRSLPQLGMVISKSGKNIPASGAEEHIAGFLLLNTLMAEDENGNLRDDFCTLAGPWLLGIHAAASIFGEADAEPNFQLTLDEAPIAFAAAPLSITDCFEKIATASYGVTLHPGDIIGVPLFADPISWPSNGMENGSLLDLAHPGLGKLGMSVTVDENA